MDAAATTPAVRQPESVVPPGIELVVDFGTVTSRAMVCHPDGRRVPLMTGGAGRYWPPGPHWSSGVFVSRDGRVTAGPEAVAAAQADPRSFCRDLKTVLIRDHVTVGDHSLEPVAGVAALLALLAEQAQQLASAPVTSLTLTTPAGWGPRHRTALRAAAQRAKLPEPCLVPVPVAAGWLLTASGLARLPAGTLLLVCDFGYAALEATLLQRIGDGFAIQATARTPDTGGHTVERLLADRCLTAVAAVDADLADRLRTPRQVIDRRERAVLDTTVHRAAQRLAAGQAVSILLPAPCPPLHLTAEEYTSLVAPVAARCADTAAGVIHAAGLDAAQLAGIYSIGGSTTDTTLHTLTERGLDAVPVPESEFAAVLGAAATPAPDQPPPAAPSFARRLDPRGVAGTIVAGCCSLGLISTALYTSEPTSGPSLRGPFPVVDWGTYAMAATCALLATTTAAPTLTRLPTARTVAGRVRIPRLTRAAIAGLIITLAYAAAGIRSLTLPWSAGTYLRWALLPALPIAALATLVAALQTRYPRQAARAEPTPRHRWFPIEATAVACLGMGFIQLPDISRAGGEWLWDLLLAWFPSTADAAQTMLGSTGGALLGAGIALAGTSSSRWRILTVPVAAAITAMVPIFNLTTELGVAFVAAASYWWGARAARLTLATASHWRVHLPAPARLLMTPAPARSSPIPPTGEGHRLATDPVRDNATPNTR